MAIEKVITIKGETKQAQRSFEDLGKTIQEQTDITIQFEKELQELEQQIKDTGNATFNPKRDALIKQSNQIKTAIKGQKVALKELNNERKKSNVVEKLTLKNATRNYGAIILLDKVTFGMASQLRNAVDAGRLFNKTLKVTRTALIATGIGAFVIALGLVVAYWDEIKELITGANKALQKQLDLTNKNIEALDFQVTLLKEQETLLNLQGKSTVANRKEQEKIVLLLTEENLERLNILKTQLDNEDSKKRELGLVDKLRIALNASGVLLGKTNTIGKEDSEKRLELVKQINDATLRSVKLQQKLAEINKPSKEDQDKITKAADEETARQDKILEIQENFRRKNEDAEDVFNIDKIERQKERALLELEALGATELEKIELLKFYNNLLKEARAEIFDEYQTNLDNEDDEEIKREDERLKRLFDAGQKEIKAAEVVANAKKAIRNANLNNIASGFKTLSSLFSKNKGLQISSIIAENAVGIAKNIVNTQAANQAATAQGAALAIPTAGASVAAAAAIVTANNISSGISIAASVAAAAKGISSLGGGGSAGGGSQPGTGGGGFSTPSFNLVRGTQGNQIANTLTNDVPPVQAYLTTGTVATGLELDRNKITESSI